MSNDESQPIPELFRLDRYDYELPAALIAQRPSEVRDQSRLLVLDESGQLEHAIFHDLPRYLRAGDLLVANDTKVRKARLFLRRRGGGSAQMLLLHPAEQAGVWEAMMRPGQRIRVGDRLRLDDACGVEIVGRSELGTRFVSFYGIDAETAMARFGQVPLPPYIKREPIDAYERYQTVYASQPGSAAAPTAGLHFTPKLVEALRAAGIGWTSITLHVGAGTFQPVHADDIRRHRMHAEHYEISPETARAIARTRARGGSVVAVGTTVVRALEDAVEHGDGEVRAGARWTRIFVYEPFEFRAADALITNFHLPRSTLLMLVCAFAGRDRVLAAYAEAVRREYRFYSFGDAMLVRRAKVRHT